MRECGRGVGREWGNLSYTSPGNMLQIRTKWYQHLKRCKDRIGESHGKRTTTDQMPEVRKTSVRMRAYTDLQQMRLLDTKRDCENGFYRCHLNIIFPLRESLYVHVHDLKNPDLFGFLNLAEFL